MFQPTPEQEGAAGAPIEESTVPCDCRTRPIETLMEFGECLAHRPLRCPYVMFSGSIQFCTNPNWPDLVRP